MNPSYALFNMVWERYLCYDESLNMYCTMNDLTRCLRFFSEKEAIKYLKTHHLSPSIYKVVDISKIDVELISTSEKEEDYYYIISDCNANFLTIKDGEPHFVMDITKECRFTHYEAFRHHNILEQYGNLKPYRVHRYKDTEKVDKDELIKQLTEKIRVLEQSIRDLIEINREDSTLLKNRINTMEHIYREIINLSNEGLKQ